MSVSYIPETVKIRLWGKAGGRCQYDGCNEALWTDSLTQAEFNSAYIAHIIADKPTGPRGDPTLSEQLKADISNLIARARPYAAASISFTSPCEIPPPSHSPVTRHIS
jgi:hypothetical protein